MNLTQNDRLKQAASFMNYPVYEIRELRFNADIGIIIAINYALQMQIKNMLDRIGAKNYILANFK